MTWKHWLKLCGSLGIVAFLVWFVGFSSSRGELVNESEYIGTISFFVPTGEQSAISGMRSAQVILPTGRPVNVPVPINAGLKIGDKVKVIEQVFERGMVRFRAVEVLEQNRPGSSSFPDLSQPSFSED